MKTGELYITDPKYSLLVFSTKRAASNEVATAGTVAGIANYTSIFLAQSKRAVKPGSGFMVLSFVPKNDKSHKPALAKVLFGDFTGWIILTSWLEFHKLSLHAQ